MLQNTRNSFILLNCNKLKMFSYFIARNFTRNEKKNIPKNVREITKESTEEIYKRGFPIRTEMPKDVDETYGNDGTHVSNIKAQANLQQNLNSEKNNLKKNYVNLKPKNDDNYEQNEISNNNISKRSRIIHL